MGDGWPWRTAGSPSHGARAGARRERREPLYTPAQRARRDRSRWTVVQAVLAPAQLAICLVSLVLVVRVVRTGDGVAAANASVVLKTLALYAIMITGSLWERDVFGRYLFAPVFFWEDVVSMVVLTLHTAWLVALATGWLSTRPLMLLALAAYATYAVNAAQFVLKLQRARRSVESGVPATGAAVS